MQLSSSVPDSFKTYPKYLNSDTYSNRAPSTRISHPNPFSPPNTITLLLSALISKPLFLHTSTKRPTITFRPSSNSTQNQIIYILETKQSPLSSLLQKPNSHPPHPHFTSFITASIYTLKSQEDMMHPCLTPLSILKQSLFPPFTLTKFRLLILTLNTIQQFTTCIIHAHYLP